VDPVDPVDPTPVDPVDPIDEGFPIDPIDPNKPLDPGTYPIIGRELATYGVIQPIARELGMLSVGTARERGGSRMLEQSQGAQVAWARVSNQHIDNAYQAFVAPEARGDLSLLQVGSDFWQRTAEDGRSVRLGAYLGHARSNIDVRGVFTNDDATGYIRDNTGKVELRATSAGLSLTHHGQRGGYLDAVVQGTRYNGSAKAGAVRLPTKGEGYVASLETGYPFVMPLANSSFVLEPQLQVIWQQVRFERGKDGAGDVDLGSTRGISARLGVRGAWQIDTAGGAYWSPYVALNHWRDPRAESSVTYAGRDEVPMLSGTGRTELTMGVEARLTQRLGVFGSTGYQLSTSDADDQKRESFNANLGVQLRW
jgi:outer membrane autotransporter protein